MPRLQIFSALAALAAFILFCAWHPLVFLPLLGLPPFLLIALSNVFARYLPEKKTICYPVAAVLGAAVLFCIFGTYFPLETKRETSANGVKSAVEYNLWMTPMKARYWNSAGSYSGPLTETGSRHGEWFFCDWVNDKGERVWYWYGEEVSEGRWHELNQ